MKRSKDFWEGAKAVAAAVHATADEDGEDMDGNIERLVELLGAVENEEDPETWGRFAAPEPGHEGEEDTYEDE